MSWTCDPWWDLYQKRDRRELGLKRSFLLLSSFFSEKGLARDIAAPLVAVVARRYLRAGLTAVGRRPFWGALLSLVLWCGTKLLFPRLSS
jgi:hypothetical protein